MQEATKIPVDEVEEEIKNYITITNNIKKLTQHVHDV